MPSKSIWETRAEEAQAKEDAIEKSVVSPVIEDTANDTKKKSAVQKKRNPSRTTLSLALSVRDKEFLKGYASMREKTVAGVIKDWIDAARAEVESREKGID